MLPVRLVQQLEEGVAAGMARPLPALAVYALPAVRRLEADLPDYVPAEQAGISAAAA